MVQPLLAALLLAAPADTSTFFAGGLLYPAMDLHGHAVADVAESTVSHPLTPPGSVGLAVDGLERAIDVLRQGLREERYPGGAIAVGRGESVVLEWGVGRVGWSPEDPPVRPDLTLFDLASLTKVIATTTAVMLLVEDGLMELDRPVADYLPFFHGEHRDRGALRITVRDLLTHTSGLPAGSSAWGVTPGVVTARLLQTPSVARPGQGVIYSDVGFCILWLAAERAAGEPLTRLLDRRVFSPLALHSFTFLPGEACPLCAPTGVRPDGTPFRGVVHDPLARRLGGVAGNAGLFGNVHDVARFAAMMANGGELNGVRVLQRETVDRFTSRQPWAGSRALGWDTRAHDGSGAAGLGFSPFAFGHTGFTGTSLWIDPDTGVWVVLLTNHTYDARSRRSLHPIRRAVHERITGSVLAGEPARGG
jgi:CubicO group peptidase (beta-lactamase class C family)